ncbi:MAG TPA: helix-turn-helix transcriptional regulator, partial [Rubrobacteraceae bacterium]|nr:helix-turn-helix transcriptional regulator [Rubrobacteraceae bacterium]
LRHMEKEGLCVSKWETSKGGPARRVYSITEAGEAYLDFWAESLEQYQQVIDTFFRLYHRGQTATKDEDKTMSSAADIEHEPRVSLRWQTLRK